MTFARFVYLFAVAASTMTLVVVIVAFAHWSTAPRFGIRRRIERGAYRLMRWLEGWN